MSTSQTSNETVITTITSNSIIKREPPVAIKRFNKNELVTLDTGNIVNTPEPERRTGRVDSPALKKKSIQLANSPNLKHFINMK